jgi:hypothetical protein
MKKSLYIFMALCSSFSAQAQIQEVLQDDVQEGRSLIEDYLSPLGDALGTALNNAWWTTAKPHKVLGFDVTLSISPVIIPASASQFDIGERGNFKGSSTPTILGNGERGEVSYTFDTPLGEEEINFKMPNGLGTGGLISPMLQAGVGLLKGTEIDLRYMPTYDLDYFEVGMMGIGIKHDLLQWIPIANKLPIDLSIMAGHTRFNSSFELEGQGVDFNVQASTINLLVSKKVLMVTAYAGVGINQSNSQLNINLGDEEMFYLGQGANLIGFNTADLTDYSFETFTDVKANVGARLQLTVLTINANYTLTQSGYEVYTAGVGISFR